MTRVPKFRAWYGIEMYDEPVICNGEFYLDWRDFEDGKTYDGAVLMQSTGIKDKNDVEIYEGDIVELNRFVIKYSERGGAYEDEEDLIGVMVYEHPSEEILGKVYPEEWGLKVNEDVFALNLLEGLHEESFQVLGNIYENKELLE